MPQLQPPQKKVTVSNLAAGFYISIAVIIDALKILLLFVDAIPFVGAPIGILSSWILSAFEFLTITFGLYISGAYKGKNSAVATLITLGEGVLDMVPLLDDAPWTTMGTILIIMRSRVNDTLEHKKAVEKFKHDSQREQANLQARQSSGLQARDRALAQGSQAASTSRALTQRNSRAA